MITTAIYSGTCSQCGQPITPGQWIDWERKPAPVSHATCLDRQRSRVGTTPSRERTIYLWTCCGQRAVEARINADELSGEAWRLARCVSTTNLRHRDNGVRVQSFETQAQLGQRLSGWSDEHVAEIRAAFGTQWTDGPQTIDWRFRGLHIWPDHRNGPHDDPDPERLHYMALSYLQGEAARITAAGGTVIASGDWNVRLLPQGYGEDVVLLPNEQAEAEIERIGRALFGS